MKKTIHRIATLAALLVCGFSAAVAQISMRPSTATRALVVGISDYQNSQIPDLQFAHRDAEAFAAFLQSPGGGSVPPDQIRLLTNAQATNANICAGLSWLMDNSAEGDVAIIYFSGHGDVESKTRSQLGFLLSWDSPPVNYAAGAVHLYYLQEVVATLSLDNKAKVMLVTDACHAGKLAGSSVGGSQATASNLARQFAQEVKILSCQPNEYSNEGTRWGGGRGVFSWHLVNGLYGMADQNGDQVVTLLEINRFLEDKVPADVAPASQIPMFFGNRSETLAIVDAPTLAEVRQHTSGSGGTAMGFIHATNQKSPRADTLPLTPQQQAMRRDFEAAVQRGQLLQPAGPDNAHAIFTRFRQQVGSHPAARDMALRLAAEMQSKGQQTFNNAILFQAAKQTAMDKAFKNALALAKEYFEKSAQIVGDKHFSHRNLRAKAAFLEALNLLDDLKTAPVGSRLAPVIAAAEAALKSAPDATYLYFALGELYDKGLNDPAKGIEFFAAAQELSPNWEAAYLGLTLATERLNKTQDPDELDTRVGSGGNASAEGDFEQNTRAADALFFAGNEPAAAAIYKKIAEKYPANPVAKSNKGLAMLVEENYDDAEPVLLAALAAAPDEPRPYSNLVHYYLVLGADGQALQYAQKAQQKWPKTAQTLYDLARVAAQSGKFAQAQTLLLEALDAGYAYPERVKTDATFANARKNTAFREALKAWLD